MSGAPIRTLIVALCLMGLGGAAHAADTGDTGDTGDTAETSEPVDSTDTYCVNCYSVTELAGEKGSCGCAAGGPASLGFAAITGLLLALRSRAR